MKQIRIKKILKITGIVVLIMVILIAGCIYGMNVALYSIIFQYASTQMINMMYKRYDKDTLFIITKKPDEVYNIILKKTNHDATLFKGVGCYKNEEKAMLEGIIKFGGKTVAEIMTSRIDMTDIDIKTNFKNLIKNIVENGYSRLPVYDGNEDNIKGIIYIKDLLPYLDRDENFHWQNLLRNPYFVPEMKMIDDLLEEFRSRKIHMAIVVDEFGGTSGIVTMEDILEEIVGEISDEYDEEEKQYTKIDNNTYIFEGKTLLNDFYKITGIPESDFVEISDEAETLAGLILEIKQDFPIAKEKINYGIYTFVVLEMNKRRIIKVKVKITPQENSNKEINK